MTATNEVWVWLPRGRGGELQPSAPELLYEARGLARRLTAELIALSGPEPAPGEAETLRAWGVAGFHSLGTPLAAHPLCPDGRSPLEAFPGIPRVFLFADDAAGKVLAPLWAAEHGAALVTGATGITADRERFVAARPAFGEQYEALVSFELSCPLAVTLVPGAVGEAAPPTPPVPAGDAPPAAVERGVALKTALGAAPGSPQPDTHIHPPDPETVDIADAERIVAFGRGAFTPEAVQLVETLARLLGASIAGSRPAADAGWLPFSRQVGLTGAIVRPVVYVAVGISGAPYHMVGVKEPETLIAINSDPEAPIFGSADLGIVGDLHQVLPALIARLERGEAVAGVRAAPGAEARG